MTAGTILLSAGGKPYLLRPRGAVTINAPATGTVTTGSPVTVNASFSRAGYAFIDYDDSLKMWWRFTNDATKGETSRIIHDWSGNGVLGWVNVDASDGCLYPSGPFGKASTELNRIYQRRNNYAMTSSFDTEDEFTFACWFKVASTSSQIDLINVLYTHAVGDTTGWFRIYHNFQNRLIIRYMGLTLAGGLTTYDMYLTDVIAVENQWAHLAVTVTYNPVQIKSYINGVLNKTTNPDGAVDPFMHWKDIQVSSTAVSGTLQVAEVMMFSRALPAAEIAALHGVAAAGSLVTTVAMDELEQKEITVYHVSNSGSLSQKSVTVTCDTTASDPSVTLLGPVSDAVRDAGTVTFSFSAESTNTGTTLSSASLYIDTVLIDTMALSGTSGEWSFNETMTANDYNWYVTVTDSDSNVGTSTTGSCTVARSNYYVATTGDDLDPGTEAAPFATIQKFCDVVKPGMTCTVAAGTYREAVTLSASGTATDPITIQAATGATVVISGADIISGGWSVHSGNIHKRDWAGTLGRGLDQVFVDGAVVLDARVPNATALIEFPLGVYECGPGSTASGTTMRINDSTNLTQADGYWTGATIHYTYSPRYCGTTALVTDYWLKYDTGTIGIVNGVVTLTGGVFPAWVADGCITVAGSTYRISTRDSDTQVTLTSLTVNVEAGASYEIPSVLKALADSASSTATDGARSLVTWARYYIAGALNALTQANEFAVADGVLYLWCPADADPDTVTVEVKQRQTGLTITGSHIDITGIDLFACNAELSQASSYVVVDDMTARYLSHYGVVTSGIEHGTHGRATTGIVMLGTHSTIKNSDLQWSAGCCVSLNGRFNTVEDSEIGWANYMHTHAAPVMCTSAFDCQILRNTIHHGCREVIMFYGSRIDIMYNDLSYCRADGWLWDLGVTYTQISRGGGGQIAYNRVHDVTPYDTANDIYALYFDGPSADWKVHHNIVGWPHNVSGSNLIAILLNGNQDMDVHHNTCQRNIWFRLNNPDGYTSTKGMSTHNNLSHIHFGNPYTGGTFSNNVDLADLTTEQRAALFVDEDNADLHLGNSSVAIDYGLDLEYEEDYDGNPRNVGAAPDAGAYEHQGV